MINPNISIQRVTEYTDEIAAGIGRLMPYLDDNFSGNPTPRDLLEGIIESSCHDQHIAVDLSVNPNHSPADEGTIKIVGALSLTEVRGAGFGRRGELEDVVVLPEARGKGVGKLLMGSVETWCRERNLPFLLLVTEAHRPAAMRLYENWGAERVTDGKNNVEGILYRKNFLPLDEVA